MSGEQEEGIVLLTDEQMETLTMGFIKHSPEGRTAEEVAKMLSAANFILFQYELLQQVFIGNAEIADLDENNELVYMGVENGI